MEFHRVPTGVLVLLIVEQSLSPRPLTLMTMEGSSDLQTLVAR